MLQMMRGDSYEIAITLTDEEDIPEEYRQA